MVVTEPLPQPVASLETPPEAAQFPESQVGSSRESCSYLSEFFIQVGSSSDAPQPSLPLTAPSGGRRVLTLEEAAVLTEEDAAVKYHCDQLSARFAQLQEAQPAIPDAAYVAQMEDLYLESQLAQLSLLTQLEEAKRVHIALLQEGAEAEAEVELLRAEVEAEAEVERQQAEAGAEAEVERLQAEAEVERLQAEAEAEAGVCLGSL